MQDAGMIHLVLGGVLALLLARVVDGINPILLVRLVVCFQVEDGIVVHHLRDAMTLVLGATHPPTCARVGD
jgi:hypothetical protein